MREKISGDMVVAVPHQDVLIIADIVNEIGYDIIAQMTMKFLPKGMFRLHHFHSYMKMENLNQSLF